MQPKDLEAGIKAFDKDKDYAAALEILIPLARQGNAEAQHKVGLAYMQGLSVAQNYAEAAKLYRLAAEQGHAEAQFWLGRAYAVGEGVEQDNVAAAKWYHLAAEQGNANAQFALAILYSGGTGVERNEEESNKWYCLSLENGHAGLQSLQDRIEVEQQLEEVQNAVTSTGDGDALKEYYKALLMTDKQHQELLNAQQELQWYEERFREASNYVSLEVPSNIKGSVSLLSQNATLGTLDEGKQQYEKVKKLKNQLVQVEAKHRLQLEAIRVKHEKQLEELQADESHEDLSSERSQIAKEINQLNKQAVWEVVWVFGVSLCAALLSQNAWVIAFAAVVTFFIRSIIN